jgi:hypothetical protein
LTKLGTKQGNFQYVQSSGDIQSTMNTTLELLELGDRTLYVKIGEDEFLPTGFDVHGRGKFVLTGENANIKGRKFSVFKDKESGENLDIETDPVQVHPNDPLATLLTVPYIQFEITRLTNEIINSKNEEDRRQRFNEISQEANDYDEKLNEILQNAFKSKSATRGELIQQCLDAKGTILQFKDMLSE